MVIVRLADRTVIRANEALARLWGSTLEAIVGKATTEFVQWTSEEERMAFMATLQEKGECLDFETTLRMNDGRLVPFSLSARTVTFGGEA